MTVTHRASFLLTTALLAMCLSAGLEAQERSYQDMRAELGRLFQEKNYAEAAALLEGALGLYPDHLLANATNLAAVRRLADDSEGALAALVYGLDHGVWFSKYAFLGDLWAPVKDMPGWDAFEARNEAARVSALADVRPRMEVVVPDGYDPERRYPLFVALHGGGENLDVFMPQWQSPLLRQDFIVAYPQSTQLIAMNGYNWMEDIPLALREIRDAYDQVLEAYSVDPDRVLVGGFSAGGVASLEVVLRDVLPVRGFVALCPPMPESFTQERVRDARDRGIRGTLLTTEMDPRLGQQRQMDEMLTQEGLPHEFSVTPNVGHWYPEDFAERIDRAINFILNSR